MEPILPEPKNEAAPTVPLGESMPLDAPEQVEVAPNVAPEKPQESVVAASSTQAQASVASTDPVIAAPPQSSDPMTASAATDDSLLADDVDVIEKEWVDKAKKIVTATKDNPHQQEKEVSKLQADYLMKRYGKQIKLTD